MRLLAETPDRSDVHPLLDAGVDRVYRGTVDTSRRAAGEAS